MRIISDKTIDGKTWVIVEYQKVYSEKELIIDLKRLGLRLYSFRELYSLSSLGYTYDEDIGGSWWGPDSYLKSDSKNSLFKSNDSSMSIYTLAIKKPLIIRLFNKLFPQKLQTTKN